MNIGQTFTQLHQVRDRLQIGQTHAETQAACGWFSIFHQLARDNPPPPPPPPAVHINI